MKKETRRSKILSTFNDIAPFLDNWSVHTRMEILAFLAGVKPAVLLESGVTSTKSVLKALRSCGIDGSISARMLMSPERILARVTSEPELARYAGWNSSLSPERNALEAWQYGSTKGGRESSALTGFLLGFPGSAIRDFDRLMAIEAPLLVNIRPDDGWEKSDIICLEVFQRQLREPGANELTWSRLHAREETRKIYARYFGLPDEDFSFFALWHGVRIPGPGGDPAYAFCMSGDGVEPPDVRRLRGDVSEGFREAGF